MIFIEIRLAGPDNNNSDDRQPGASSERSGRPDLKTNILGFGQ